MSTPTPTTVPGLATTATTSLPGPVVNGTWPLVSTGNATTTATNLVLPELTTRFVPPAQCTPVQSWTAATINGTGEGFPQTTYTQIFLPVTNAQYSACQPSGWDRLGPQYQFSYSKAVCPSGYNYNQLSDLYHPSANTETILTTAYCCPSGFKYTVFYDEFIQGISGTSCIKTTTLTGTTQATTTATTTGTPTGSASSSSPGSESTTTSPSLVARNATVPLITTLPLSVVTMFYQPWNIVWEKKDASLLSPSPPVVSVQNPVKTWEPGTEIDPNLRRTQSNPAAIDRNLGQIIGIVAGCVAAAFAGILAICAWFYFRSRRRRRQEFEREEQELQEQRLRHIGEYHRSRDPADDEPLPVYVKSREHDRATVSATGVPPYKERPSSESSRHSQHENWSTGSPNIRQGMTEDSDGPTFHDQHASKNATQQNGTQSPSDGNRRHE